MTMLKTIVGVSLILTTAYVTAADVDKPGKLVKGTPYCTSIGNLEDFSEYIIDGDQAGASRMVDQGKCSIASKNMNVRVFIEEKSRVAFMSPSGKALWTIPGMIEH